MLIGERLRQLRQEKGLSQNDIGNASSLFRPYISRVEHGHTVPSLETLERFAAAMDVPLYRLFDAGTGLPAPDPVARSLAELADETGPSGSEARFLVKLRGLLGRMTEQDKAYFLDFAQRLADCK